MKNRYFSKRVRARKVRHLLKECGGTLNQATIVKKWIGYLHPEAHLGPETPYQNEAKQALRRFLEPPHSL